MASEEIIRTGSVLKIQVEPNNSENNEEKEFHGESDPSALKLNETFSILKNSDVSETLSKPQIHCDDPPDSFFKAMKPVVILAQCFGFMPVIGITGPNHRSLKFKWLQWRMLYGLFAYGGLLFMFIISFLDSAESNFAYRASQGLIFYGSQIPVACFWIQIAKKWPKINEEFAGMDLNFSKYGDFPKTNLKFKVITSMLMALAAVQYFIEYYTFYVWYEPCYELEGFGSRLKTFLIIIYRAVFSRIPYSHWTGVLIIYFDVLFYFTWTFRDLFLALIIMSLLVRSKQLNGVLYRNHGQEMPALFWQTIREDYNELSTLITKVDSDVQKLILFSIVENMYTLCKIILLKIQSVTINIYDRSNLFLILGLLILKASLVLFPAASIHEESKKAKKVVFSIPPNGYCLETQRFLTQLATDEISLTGWGFFSVTRGLILTLVGTLITYVIIFVQFSKNLGFAEGELEIPKFNKSECATFKLVEVS